MSTTLEQLSDDLAAATERAARSVVAIHARRRIPASGVVWRAGLVVATDHTIQKDEDVRVTLADGRDVRARVVGRDPGTDLCVLALAEGTTADAAVLSRTPLKVGQLALALGRPGEAATASLGVVSAVGPEWRTWRGGRVDQFVRLDLAIYDGFSGGPLVNAAGHVTGICTSGLARGAAVVVPAATVDRVVDQLASGGRTRPGFLGVGTQPVRLPDSVRERLSPVGGQVPRAGLMIVAVEPKGPADVAGLLMGDVIVGLGDERVEDPRDVMAALGPDTVGKPLQATIVRAGAPMSLTVSVGEHPGRA